jgi:hypothetical protein
MTRYGPIHSSAHLLRVIATYICMKAIIIEFTALLSSVPVNDIVRILLYEKSATLSTVLHTSELKLRLYETYQLRTEIQGILNS